MTKIQLRNAWFQVHKWIGLILAVLIIPLCLTGSALVWHDGLERIVESERYATSGSTLLAPDAYAAAAAKALKPGERITQLKLPAHPGDPVVVSAAAAGNAARPGPPVRTNVYLDPPTARVLQVANSRAGVMMVLHVLHGSLMVPGVGRSIVGWLGVAMLVSCVSGIWLWWPTVGSWARGLRWKRHRNFDTNLHHLFGFWIAIPLFVLSLTGAWISFPAFFGSLVGEGARPGGPDRAAMMRAKPLEAPATPFASAVAKAQAVAPGAVTQVTWPTDLKGEWQVAIKGKGAPANVTVDDKTGVAKAGKAPERAGGTSVARTMRKLHDGDDMGIVWQVIIFLGGILPAVLAVTGVIMWWRGRGWRAQLKARQKAKVAAAQ